MNARSKTHLILKWIAASLLSVGLIILSIVTALFCANEYTVTVVPYGDAQITLEYGTAYEEPGATATVSGSLLQKAEKTVDVQIQTDTDLTQVGTHVVRYVAQFEDTVGTAYRYVTVVDSQAPQIQLVTDPEKFTFPNETYEEEGFTALDNYDGDITAAVLRSESREEVTYTVADSSGNYTTVTRPIIYNDPVPPVLTLSGEKEMTLGKGRQYHEPGYNATDNCDGDITNKVTVSGRVDPTKPGEYTLVYTVKDSFQNSVSASRKVTVEKTPGEPIAAPAVVVPEGKVIYLTFDDGPGPRTPELLDILKKYNVKATFFVVNTAYIGTIKRAAEEGHSIAIHTKTHNFRKIYASEEAYYEDLYAMQDIIKAHTGQVTTLLRFPGGSSNTISRFNRKIMTRLTKSVVDNGFQYFDWNVDSNDAGGARTANEVFQNVINGVSKKQTSIVLQHDIKDFSIDAVERIIQWGLANGYTFLPLQQNSPGCHHNVYN